MYDVIYFDLLLVHEFLFFSLNVRFILRSLQKNVKTDFIYEMNISALFGKKMLPSASSNLKFSRYKPRRNKHR